MIIIRCEILRRELYQGEYFYIIRDIKSKETHSIYASYVELFDKVRVGEIYSFVDEVNHTLGKRFLNIIHPDYFLGNEIKLKIINTINSDGRNYFLLETPYLKEITIGCREWQSDLRDVTCKVMGYKRGLPVLKNIDNRNSRWKIGNREFFKITSFGKIRDFKNNIEVDGITVQIEINHTKNIKGSDLHKEGVWTFDNIQCEIIGIDRNGHPNLKICDDRHPTFTLGEQYDFVIEGFKKKILKSGNILPVIILKGVDGVTYEVMQLPNQENHIKIGDNIKCKVVEIGYSVKLLQVELYDPYFYKFEEVVGESRNYQNYFQQFLNEDNEFNNKLKDQYESRSGFWIITLCNNIIPRLKKDLRNRKNFKDLKEVIEMNLVLENWILQKGLLRSISDQHERKTAKKKVELIIRLNTVEYTVIKKIVEFQEHEMFTDVKEENVYLTFYFYLLNKDFLAISVSHFISCLHTLEDMKVSIRDTHYINKIIELVKSGTGKLKQKFNLNYFILSNNLQNYQKTEINNFINWLYVIMQLYKHSQNIFGVNLILSQIYRYKFYFYDTYEDKRCLLLNAFDVVSNINKVHLIPLEFNERLNQVNIVRTGLKSFKYDKLDILYNTVYSTVIVEKHYKGYKVKVGQGEGFLPYHNLNDNNLKKYDPLTVEWETTIEATHISNDFKYFICKQISSESPNYISRNKMRKKFFDEGEIITVVVDHIAEFGIFVCTDLGIGLLHITEVSDSFISNRKLHDLFLAGEKLTVYCLPPRDGKLTFSLKKLIGTDYENEYYKIFEKDFLEFESTDAFKDREIDVELEKGFIFEQFALIQEDVQKKIKYVKFAKLFFSNTNNARSYLLNIYIEYFEALIKLDFFMEDYSFKKYDLFKTEIIKIKEKLQPQTLENFPESKNLIFFIDVLNFFNNKDESSLEDLFNLLRTASRENNHLLKMVAKNALSNNLLITEIQDNEIDSFTYKNLKRIREFISQGVLSVEETEEDRFEKELNLKRDYWRGIIGQDEGEKLEFKASLFVPVPNNEKMRIIKTLQEQLQITTNEHKAAEISNKIEQLENESRTIPHIGKILIHSAFKNICAFANTLGGTLLIGVGDDKGIYGLGNDYSRYSRNHRDEFGKDFDAKIKEYFGESFSSLHLPKREILAFPEGDILIIEVKPSHDEVFLLKNEKGEKEENIYVRNLSSSEKLVGRELAKFIKSRKMAQT